MFEKYNENQKAYLEERILGAGVDEACRRVGITRRVRNLWRKANDEFSYDDSLGLPELKRKYRDLLVAERHTEIVTAMMEIDKKLVNDALTQLENEIPLSDEELKAINKIRPSYTAQQVKAMKGVEVETPKQGISIMDYLNKLQAERLAEAKLLEEGQYRELPEGREEQEIPQ